MTKQPAFCQSYEEARELFIKGELQAWDGTRWEDVPKDANCFFSRRVEEYRQRPEKKPAPGFAVFRRNPDTGRADNVFKSSSAHEVATFLWGKDLESMMVFKLVSISGYDLREIEKQLNEA